MLGRDPLGFLLQKAGHFLEYLVLALILYRAVRGTLRLMTGAEARGSWRAYLWTLATAVVFAASDEWHQSFVPHREPALRDVLIDAAGAVAAIALVRWSEKRRRERQSHA